MPTAATDKADRGRDLLFGVIALQMNFVNQAQFVEVMTLLPSQPEKGAEDLFREKEYLEIDQAAALRALIEAQLKKNGGDVAKSIAAFEENEAVERTLVLIGERPARPTVGTPAVLAIGRGGADEDRYALGKELGRGGLGKVVIALDQGLLAREVAMKLMLPEDGPRSPSPGALVVRDRFLEEARITAQLQHPNVVSVHELGTRPGGDLYYTMDVVRGRTLLDVIREAHDKLDSGEVPLERWGVERLRLLSAFEGLCHAIAFAHSRGVIHRDIKPANVMAGDYGETTVLDWGLAKLKRGAGTEGTRSDRDLSTSIRALGELRGHETLPGTISGTPAYMSPEQAAGKIEEIDERSDIWSLGAVLFEILTGRPPFDGTSAYEILFKVMAGNVPDPREASGTPVPEDLATVCLKAMRKEKAERYGSVKELLDDITLSIEGGKERERKHGWCVPIHFTRYHPDYRLRNLPDTPVATLERAREIAKAEGIRFPYVGNVPGHPFETTYCPNCSKPLIRRVGYRILEKVLSSWSCPACKTRIPGVWS